MCGRYSAAGTLDEFAKMVAFICRASFFAPRYNIAPRQQAPVLLLENGEPTVKLMRWGAGPRLGVLGESPNDTQGKQNHHSGKPDMAAESSYPGMAKLPSPHCGDSDVSQGGLGDMALSLEMGEAQTLQQINRLDTEEVLASCRGTKLVVCD